MPLRCFERALAQAEELAAKSKSETQGTLAGLPIAVAGLGTGQAAFVWVFRDYGDPETLLACSLALSAGLILLRVGMGLAFAREYAREAIQAARQEEA